MKLRLEKPWLPLEPATVARLPGQLGVYQIADADRRVTYIGFAGGKSLFGLRGELQKHLGDDRKRFFRHEVNQQYQTRWRELLMFHQADSGELPEFNREEPMPRLGRLG